MGEEGSSSKPPTTSTTLHVREDYDFFEELLVDTQREEEDASQAL